MDTQAAETFLARHPNADPIVYGTTAHAARVARVSDEAGMVSRAAVAARTGQPRWWQNDPRHTQLP